MSTAIRATALSAAGLSVFGSFRFFAAFTVFGGRASGRGFRAPSFCVSATIPSYQKRPRAWLWRGGFGGTQPRGYGSRSPRGVMEGGCPRRGLGGARSPPHGGIGGRQPPAGG